MTTGEEDQTCPQCGAELAPAEWGPCALCGARIHRYGDGSHGPLCRTCQTSKEDSAA